MSALAMSPPHIDVASDAAALLVQGLSKHFGGLLAVNAVSLRVEPNSIHAVIGPNGAGKSTLTHLLSGDLPATAGTVRFGEVDLTPMSAQRRSHHGISRSYQKTNVFGSFSAFENCRLAAQSRRQHPWQLFARARACDEVCDRARDALARVGLLHRAERAAAAMSHGEQRQLEIAMALATQPRVLLLDEPLAGTGQAEAERVVELLAVLGRSHAVLLIEHDMDAVFALAHQLTVMVNGSVLKSGTPAEVRADREVQQAYLGDEV